MQRPDPVAYPDLVPFVHPYTHETLYLHRDTVARTLVWLPPRLADMTPEDRETLRANLNVERFKRDVEQALMERFSQQHAQPITSDAISMKSG